MKTFMLFFCLIISLSLYSQCETSRYINSYIQIPSFFGLYFNNQCVSQPLSDTTICVKIAQTNQTQVAAFSYSSPSGFPAFVSTVRQYDSQCVFYEEGSLIPAGQDTITICYDIQAQLIDNFCPYTILSGGLSVEFCEFSANYSNGNIDIFFQTCSNSGTYKFEIITSSDVQNWITISSLPPVHETTSSSSIYNVKIPFNKSGIQYFAIREHDLNGSIKISNIVYVEVPINQFDNHIGIDILGRTATSGSYMFYVKSN